MSKKKKRETASKRWCALCARIAYSNELLLNGKLSRVRTPLKYSYKLRDAFDIHNTALWIAIKSYFATYSRYFVYIRDEFQYVLSNRLMRIT